MKRLLNTSKNFMILTLVIAFMLSFFAINVIAGTENYSIKGGVLVDDTYWVSYGDQITIIPAVGYTISAAEDESYATELKIEVSADNLSEAFVFYLKDENGTVSKITDAPIGIDTCPAIGRIELSSGNSFDELAQAIIFDNYYESLTATIKAIDDSGSGIKSIEYYLASEKITDDEFFAIEDWKPYSIGDVINLPMLENVILYVKIIDNVGNEQYISTNGMYIWGTETENSGVKNYVSNDGITSTPVGADGVSWLKEQSSGESAWFAIDNSNNEFENASRFMVQWLDKASNSDAGAWNHYYNELDSKYKNSADENKMWIFNIDVNGPDGSRYGTLSDSVDVYVQLPDHWDASDINAVYIASGADESVPVSVVDKMSPEGEIKVAVLELKHFSPYVIYQNIKPEKPNTQGTQNVTSTNTNDTDSSGTVNDEVVADTADNNTISLWVALMAVSACGYRIVRNKNECID